MSQQGERHDGASGQEDDWWGQLYDDSAHDTGPAEAADTLDDRFASAVSAAGEGAADPAPVGEGAEGTLPRPGRFPDPEPPPPEFRDRRGAPGATGDLTPRTPDPAAAGEPSGRDTGAGAAQGEPFMPREPSAPPGPAPSHEPSPPPPSYEPPPPTPPSPPPAARVRPGAAPWEPPAAPTGPVTFPAGPTKPPGDPSRTTAVPAPRTPEESAVPEPQAPDPVEREPTVTATAVEAVSYVGDGPPTYDAEPTVLPAADPDDLGDLVADTVLDGARYGTSTLRAVSVRGDSARYRGEPRRDSLLTARFGTGDAALVLVAMATGARATPGAHRAAAEACAWIGRAVGRSHQRLSEDIRAARRGDLKSGLHRLTDRSLGKLRAHAVDLGIEPEEYAASLRCLLLPADPECRTRVFFGVGGGGLFRLRDGTWQDIEPRVSDTAGDAGPPVVGFGSVPPETPEGDRLTMDMGIITPPSPYEPAPEPPPREPFRFRASVARPGDALMLCSGGLAEPLRGEPDLAAHLTQRWAKSGPPGLATFLADVQVRVKGYADDRTAAAVWEA
ncbi:protein phosphatase 2C domain-containing protein [Streptomyces sp. NBC_01283]|uniref:protein phosphatase 2C domain-containing protein n=1 Tax=Streptomyces sp. NBC_01283 TaxID=2903812 RepID=UPI00352BF506|nr:protein phosphatase 2C domain-containing protein [Streptomyces sp. NBC_01283]